MATDAQPLDRNDTGKGSLRDYRGVLEPRNRRVRIRLAGSNPHQDDIREIVAAESAELETGFGRRTQDEERVDAPIEVRVFTGTRVSGPVGFVPRGLESVVDETLSRLETLGRKPRIPVEIIRKGGLYRVELLIGLARD
jgi:hypothetical protein